MLVFANNNIVEVGSQLQPPRSDTQRQARHEKHHIKLSFSKNKVKNPRTDALTFDRLDTSSCQDKYLVEGRHHCVTLTLNDIKKAVLNRTGNIISNSFNKSIHDLKEIGI